MILTMALIAVLQANPPAEPANAAPSAAPKMVCVWETPTGSNFDRKICHTAEQWKQLRDEDAGRSSAITLTRQSNPRPR